MSTAWLISKSGHTEITIHGKLQPVIKIPTYPLNLTPSAYGKEYINVIFQTVDYYLSKMVYQQTDKTADVVLYVHQDYAPDPLELIFNKYNEPKGWRLTRRKP